MYDFFYSTEQILDAFFRISTLLTFPSRVDDILQRILDDVVDTMGFHRGIICLFDETKENLITKVVKNYSPEEARYAFSTNLNIHKHDCLETRAAKSGYYIALEDAETDPRITEADRKITQFYKRGSTFYAALKIQDEVIGIICLWSKEKTRFSDNEIGILLTFANQISIVIHNTRLFEDNQNRIERLVVLQEAVSHLNANYVLDNIHTIIIDHALKIGAATKALIYFLDVKKDKYLISDGGIVVGDREKELMTKINHSIIRNVLDSGETIIRNQKDNSGIPSLFEECSTEVAIPLNIAEKFKAVLYLAKQDGSFGPDEVNVLDILIKNAAASYDNAIMHSLLSMEAESLKTKVEMLKQREDELLGFHDIIGSSNKIQGIFHVITEVAKHDTNVLIQGESGTGKELMARAIHRQSDRKSKRFVDVNCAAIPGTLLESEIFGYEAGAFTDARKRKLGLIEYANGGTLLLDEIGDMNLQLQAKFLRMLEDGHIRRLGGNENIPINVRFIFSTNRDLNRMVSDGLFREDLYYRISVVPITIPPLRERDNDIIILSQHYVEEFNNKFNKKVSGFTGDAEKALIQYPWPGNVRELKNIIERVMILQNVGTYITKENLPAEIQNAAVNDLPISSDDEYVLHADPRHAANYRFLIDHLTTKVKERILTRTLELSKGNKTVAARRLGISRYTLIRELKKVEQKNFLDNELPTI
jgi:two-component system response regulator AtoC